MIEFFQAGGYHMFVVLLFGALTIAAAVALMARGRAETVGVVRALSTATVFSALTGVGSDLAMVCKRVPETPEWAHSPDLPLIVMTGIGESLAPAVLGFGLLSIAWLITAAGVRRLATA